MLWLVPVVLSFNAIMAIVPVVIVLLLIAAAAGLTRGSDIFALFGLGAIMGFAKPGGKVGKGFRNVRYGGDAIKRGKSAKKVSKGLFGQVKKVKKAGKARKQEKLNKLNRKGKSLEQKKERYENRAAKLREKGGSNNVKNGSKQFTRVRNKISSLDEKSARAGDRANRISTKRENLEKQYTESAAKRASGKGLMGHIDMAVMTLTLAERRAKHEEKKIKDLEGKTEKLKKDIDSKKGNEIFKGNKIFTKYHKGKTTLGDLLEEREKHFGIDKSGNIYVKKLTKQGDIQGKTKSYGDVKITQMPKRAYLQKGAMGAVIVSHSQKKSADKLSRLLKKEKENPNSLTSAERFQKERLKARVDKYNGIIQKSYLSEKGKGNMVKGKNTITDSAGKKFQESKRLVDVNVPIPLVWRPFAHRYGAETKITVKKPDNISKEDWSELKASKDWGDIKSGKNEINRLSRELQNNTLKLGKHKSKLKELTERYPKLNNSDKGPKSGDAPGPKAPGSTGSNQKDSNKNSSGVGDKKGENEEESKKKKKSSIEKPKEEESTKEEDEEKKRSEGERKHEDEERQKEEEKKKNEDEENKKE